ncbi:MAG: TetR-like C-terminal domain-containing protein [Staphylococcus simulans]|nr:TetR-like C-terminal domain-containing protein [Staphylococcus simulans]
MNDYTRISDKIYFAHYLIGGQLGVIHTWLRRDCTEAPEAMAQTMLVNTIKMRQQA